MHRKFFGVRCIPTITDKRNCDNGSLLNISVLLKISNSVILIIYIQRSHDFGGEDDIFIKRKLSSLLFVNRLIENYIQELNEGSENNYISNY